MEIFTLTPSASSGQASGQALTLSLKGEGIAELRKSYQDQRMFRMWEYVEYPDLSYNPVNPDSDNARGWP